VDVVHSTGAGVKVPPTAEISTLRRYPGCLVTLNFASWNLIGAFLKRIDVLRRTGTGQPLATVARFPSR
jgi:hypothetical protein